MHSTRFIKSAGKRAVSTAVFDCSVDMLAQICPPWVDGHWFINSNKILPLVRSSSGISSVYNMRVNGTSSQVYNITGLMIAHKQYIVTSQPFKINICW